MFTTFLEVDRYICAFKFYLSTIIITNQHKTMNKSVLTSSWRGMRRQTLEQNQEWRFIRRQICTYYIVTTTCLGRYIVIKKSTYEIDFKKCICCKRIQLGCFFLFNYQIHPNQVAMFPNQSTHSECNRKIGVVYMYVM